MILQAYQVHEYRHLALRMYERALQEPSYSGAEQFIGQKYSTLAPIDRLHYINTLLYQCSTAVVP